MAHADRDDYLRTATRGIMFMTASGGLRESAMEIAENEMLLTDIAGIQGIRRVLR